MFWKGTSGEVSFPPAIEEGCLEEMEAASMAQQQGQTGMVTGQVLHISRTLGDNIPLGRNGVWASGWGSR